MPGRYVTYCMDRVRLLRGCGVVPVLVFDGGRLPMKALEEASRAKYATAVSLTGARDRCHLPVVQLSTLSRCPCGCRARKEHLQRAAAHLRAGNASAANECFQKAVDISPAVAKRLIDVSRVQLASCILKSPCVCCIRRRCHYNVLCAMQALKRDGVEFIVAPYEADAQMAYMALSGDVDAVITEDSDLLAYGCPKVGDVGCSSLCMRGFECITAAGDLCRRTSGELGRVASVCRCCSRWTGQASARKLRWRTSTSTGSSTSWASRRRCSSRCTLLCTHILCSDMAKLGLDAKHEIASVLCSQFPASAEVNFAAARCASWPGATLSRRCPASASRRHTSTSAACAPLFGYAILDHVPRTDRHLPTLHASLGILLWQTADVRMWLQVSKSLRFSCSVPRTYEEDVQRAVWTFRHQRVFCPSQRGLVHLRPLPEGGLAATAAVPSAVSPEDEALDFLGPPLPDIVACQVAAGNFMCNGCCCSPKCSILQERGAAGIESKSNDSVAQRLRASSQMKQQQRSNSLQASWTPSHCSPIPQSRQRLPGSQVNIMHADRWVILVSKRMCWHTASLTVCVICAHRQCSSH